MGRVTEKNFHDIKINVSALAKNLKVVTKDCVQMKFVVSASSNMMSLIIYSKNIN